MYNFGSHNWSWVRTVFGLSVIVGLTFCLGCFTRWEPASQAPKPTRTHVESVDDDNSAGPFALVLVDMQHEFFTPDLRSYHSGFAGNVSELLAFCRASGIEVIHVRTEFDSTDDLPDSYRIVFGGRVPCLRGTPGAQPLAFAREHSGERVFYKNQFNAFSNEGLHRYLKAHGREHLIVAGLTTDLCVISSTLGAVDRGFLVSLVEDCCLSNSPAAHEFVVQRYGGFLFDAVSHDEVPQRLQVWLETLKRNRRPLEPQIALP